MAATITPMIATDVSTTKAKESRGGPPFWEVFFLINMKSENESSYVSVAGSFAVSTLLWIFSSGQNSFSFFALWISVFRDFQKIPRKVALFYFEGHSLAPWDTAATATKAAE